VAVAVAVAAAAAAVRSGRPSQTLLQGREWQREEAHSMQGPQLERLVGVSGFGGEVRGAPPRLQLPWWGSYQPSMPMPMPMPAMMHVLHAPRHTRRQARPC
jgi:hypothetical protein